MSVAEIVEDNKLQIYSSASEMAEAYRRAAQEAVEIIGRLHESLRELNRLFDTGDFRVEATICGEHDPIQIAREMKRVAWRILLQKLGIEKVMSTKVRNEMREAFCSTARRGRDDDPINRFPDISADSIEKVLSGYVDSSEEFLNESIHELYGWLKPSGCDEYKTNAKNRWKVSRRVILTWAVDRFSERSRWSVCGRQEACLHGLDNVMHLLDGKKIPDSHRGELISAIIESDGAGETKYFKFRCFKNKNLHLEFLRMDLVQEFNYRCGNQRELPGEKSGAGYQGRPVEFDHVDTSAGKNGEYDLFETPVDLAVQMVELAGVGQGTEILEPSGGRGRIVRAAVERGARVTCCEIQDVLIGDLLKTGARCLNDNFLEVVPSRIFGAVVMNPPFSDGQAVRHIEHAWKFLADGGTLVAVAPSGIKFRQDHQHRAFREWMDSVDAVVTDLPAGTFSDSGTRVSTVLIVIRRRCSVSGDRDGTDED